MPITVLRPNPVRFGSMRTFEAIIDEQGRIRLLQPLEAGARGVLLLCFSMRQSSRRMKLRPQRGGPH